MNSATYFPDQRHLMPLTTIRRERLLPEGAVGEIESHEGERVDLRDVIARGAVPSRYVIVEAAEQLGLKKPEDLQPLLLVDINDVVEAGQIIAGKSSGRGKRVLAPSDGVVASVADGRIIIQQNPEAVEVEAGLIGQVVALRESRGVVIETIGAVLQGVWGNNRVAVGALTVEPNAGMETISSDALNSEFRGTIVVARKPLTVTSLQVLAEQGLAAVIAPSMDVNLIDVAMQLRGAVLLTEGFGTTRMSKHVSSFLEALAGKQATVDAATPDRFEARRPEVIVNMPVRAGQRPPMPDADLTLDTGMTVRMTRGSMAGLVGQIVHLPKTPYLLDNGLRVPCAQVQLVTGESAFIPLANLEVFGQ
jgi:hypothetical protein